MDNILLQQACSNTVVFQSSGKTILTIALTSPIDTTKPATVFCYSVTQHENNPDLRYWILGLCENITADNIVNVTVTINGTSVSNPSYEVTTENGVYGIKINHGLANKGDVMVVCITLNKFFEVGPNSVIAATQQGQTITLNTGENLCTPCIDPR